MFIRLFTFSLQAYECSHVAVQTIQSISMDSSGPSELVQNVDAGNLLTSVTSQMKNPGPSGAGRPWSKQRSLAIPRNDFAHKEKIDTSQRPYAQVKIDWAKMATVPRWCWW